jgi:hypothetical protein
VEPRDYHLGGAPPGGFDGFIMRTDLARRNLELQALLLASSALGPPRFGQVVKVELDAET